mmetsp:Transcript_34375/g.99840  ORF Transcript_34375/g.99840 Transcript_34375/m.99840 type:complete len:221 (-) Transcript_34375:568-1230(-)
MLLFLFWACPWLVWAVFFGPVEAQRVRNAPRSLSFAAESNITESTSTRLGSFKSHKKSFANMNGWPCVDTADPPCISKHENARSASSLSKPSFFMTARNSETTRTPFFARVTGAANLWKSSSTSIASFPGMRPSTRSRIFAMSTTAWGSNSNRDMQPARPASRHCQYSAPLAWYVVVLNWWHISRKFQNVIEQLLPKTRRQATAQDPNTRAKCRRKILTL